MQPNPKTPDTVTPPAISQEPVYTVIMPPLSFDASSPAPPPEPSPETMLLVREVRMRPTVAFRGHVNPAPPRAVAIIHVAPPPPKPVDDRRAETQAGLMTRLRTFFQKLTGQPPCAGAECGH